MNQKHRTYKIKLTILAEGGEEVITFIQPHLPVSYTTIAEANRKRRAIQELFGELVGDWLISVQRVPTKTTQRILKI